MKSIESLYEKAYALAKAGENFTEELFKHQPSFENNGKKSLIVLAGVARYLGQQYEVLGIDLIRQYEKEQLNGK